MKKFLSQNLFFSIFLVSLFIIVSFSLYYFSHGLNVMYGDARAHLNIARRVMDSTNPGMAQLGGIWLPLLHFLMLPTIGIDFFWHSGLSGAIVNISAFLVSVYFIYKIGRLFFDNKIIILIVPFFYLTNPNLIYMSTTPMTESLFIATITGAYYYLLKWLKDEDVPTLIKAALFFLLSSINRYEGWTLAFAAFIIVGIATFIRKKSAKKIESNLILFGSLAFIGIFLWLIWQITIFGDPLYFMKSMYSSKLQTTAGFQVENSQSAILANNFPLSALANFYSILENDGGGLIVVGLVGILVGVVELIKSFKNKRKLYALIVPVILTPYLFLTYAVYKGQVPLLVPQINHGTFNIRYGLYLLPSLTILSLILVRSISKKPAMRILLLSTIILTQLFLFLPSFLNPITLQAGNEGIELKVQAAHWIGRNYKNGNVLASSATGDPLLFDSGLHLKEFITDGSNTVIQSALAQPEKYAKYVVISREFVDSKRDIVNLRINRDSLKNNYSLKFRNKVFDIYVRNK